MAKNKNIEYGLYKNQNYSRLKEECLKNGELFQDDYFPMDVKGATWLRPGKIVENPRFFVEGASRLDAVQGDAGNCWLVVAMANLTLNQKLFDQVVPKNQLFIENYAGIFHFRLWQCGKWIDFVIDDRLPTKDGKLIYVHSETENEFWSALLEKAYAKAYGSYNSMTVGWFCEAMVDFTGGVVERLSLMPAPSDLNEILLNAFKKSSFMCSFMRSEHIEGKQELVTKEGLVKGHAYSITWVQYIPTLGGSKELLVRLRNPWGTIEWKGAWSDNSKEWRSVPEEVKGEVQFVKGSDGEFWMSVTDFAERYEYIDICHLSPDTFNNMDYRLEMPHLWESHFFKGEWVKGVTAGGFSQDTFYENPQFRITLTDMDDDEDGLCTIIIALMQRNATRNIWHKIGFTSYTLENPEKLPKVLDKEYLKEHFPESNSSKFKRVREVVVRDKWPIGVYCIIPSTYKSNMEGKFLLRIFTEKAAAMEESHHEPISKISQAVTMPRSSQREITPRYGSVQDSYPTKARKRYLFKTDSEVMAYLRKVMGQSDNLTWQGLQSVLHYAMNLDKSSSTDSAQGNIFTSIINWLTSTFSSPRSDHSIFSKDECRNLIALIDFDKSGTVTVDEFQVLWNKIRLWESIFVDSSGDKDKINLSQLRDALLSAGYRVKSGNLGRFRRTFADDDGNFAFDDFVMCAINMEVYSN